MFIPSSTSNTFNSATILNGTDAIILQTPPLPLVQGTSTVLILFTFTVAVGGAGVGTVRIRRGNTLASPIINVTLAVSIPGSGLNQVFSAAYADINNASISGQQYSVSLNNISLAASNITDGSITAMVL